MKVDYTKKLNYHYKPQKGWVNDPNGLVYFKGYYHVFYQHAPHFEKPWNEAMYWGHARTKDFITWEELPVALTPETNYDVNGCWSGTAIVKDDTLYLFYASITAETRDQTVSVAYSTDGVNFTKYEGNPVISKFPTDGGPDFRDPAVCYINGQYYLVMATGHKETKKGRLLLYKSENLFDWEYVGIMCEWDNCHYTECPSLVPDTDYTLLTASVCPLDTDHYFALMYGHLNNDKFEIVHKAQIDKGPDQYAGQVFHDHLGRNLLITWIPGWPYNGFAEKDVGCMSIPRELKIVDGKVTGYPVKEVQHLLKDTDESVKFTDKGFIVERNKREPFVYEGEIRDIKILRDEFILEIFVNGGEEIFSILL